MEQLGDFERWEGHAFDLFLFYWELEVLASQPPKHPNPRTPEGNVVAAAVWSRPGQVQKERD